MKSKYVWPAVLFAVLIFIFFYKLGQRPLLEYDESIYAQVAKESFIHHNQLGFTWIGNLGLQRSIMWFEKPPLMIWSTELSYKIFGITEFAARFWVAIFALLTVALTYFFVLKIFKSQRAALLSLACYFIAFQFIYNSGVLQFDLPATFFILAGLFCFWQAKTNSKYYYWFWIATGLGLMTKSVIGLLPLPIISLYSLIAWDWKFLKAKQFWLGILIFLVIAVPWHVIESLRYGSTFWNQYFSYHVLDRYTTALEGNSGSFWFYWKILWSQKLLFYLALIGSGFFLYKTFKEKSIYLYTLIAAIFIFLFFSSAQTKLTAYILVIYPYLVIITAVSLDKALLKIESKKAFLSHAATFCFVILCVALGLRYNNYRLLTNKDPNLTSDKTAGQFLATNYLSSQVYLNSLTGIDPAVTFYSNRVVYFLKNFNLSSAHNIILISPDQSKNLTYIK